jgi:outer membrane protein W
MEPNEVKRLHRTFNRGRVFGAALCLAWVASAPGQGITRSTGLGIRGTFWKVGNRSTGLRVNSRENTSSVDVEGLGGELTFFSRLHENWFIETALGSVARVHVKRTGLFDSDVDVSAVIPLILGTRYDFLTGRIRSAVQPYLCAGAGAYWMVKTLTASEGISETDVSVGSDFKFGGYAGFGAHFTPASWFALNFDARYHFVDFSKANPNSGLEIGGGFVFMWGKQREIFRIASVKVIVEDIYPAYYRFYNTYPMAMVAVENTAGFPIEVNLRSWIDGITDGVRQNGFVPVPAGETRDLPVYLLFGPELLRADTREPAVIDFEIEARSGVTLKKSFSAQVTVHSRNAWNGEIDKLPVFVTPDDSTVRALSSGLLKQDTSAGAGSAGLRKFRQARSLFEGLSRRGMRYQSDPNIPFDRDDRVQFAAATLALGAGDCDDLAVLAASLFESVGISTAFVDVSDPQAGQGHVYLLFDTGLAPEQGATIAANEKRTVVRRNPSGASSLWIPLETTLMPNGFETAWVQGAAQFEEEGNIRQGLAEGWMKIIDVR